MKNKLLTVLFAALLLTSSILSASCGNGSGDNAAATENTASTAESPDQSGAAASESEIPSEYVSPGSDYSGATFCFAAYQASSYSWRAASYCEAFASEETGETLNDALYQRNRSVEETLNVKLECYGVEPEKSRNISESVIKLILAGDDSVDAAYITGEGVSAMIGTGDMSIDLNTISTLDLSHSWWDQSAAENLKLNGRIYTATGDISLYAQFSPVVLFVNKAMVENYSLDDPYESVRNGSWTLDETMKLAEAVSSDLNGDGVRGVEDSWGMTCELGTLNYMLGSCGVKLMELDSEGAPVLTYNTSKTADIYEKLVPFLSGKTSAMLSSDYKAGYNNVFSDLFTPMFMDDRILFFNNQLLVAMNLRDMDSDFGILPLPKYDESQETYIGMTNTSWITFVMIPATNGELDYTGDVLEAMGYYSQKLVTPAYIDSTIVNKTMRDSDSEEMLDIILGSRSYDLAYYYNFGGIYSIANDLLDKKSTNFVSQYESAESQIQASIDSLLDSLK